MKIVQILMAVYRFVVYSWQPFRYFWRFWDVRSALIGEQVVCQPAVIDATLKDTLTVSYTDVQPAMELGEALSWLGIRYRLAKNPQVIQSGHLHYLGGPGPADRTAGNSHVKKMLETLYQEEVIFGKSCPIHYENDTTTVSLRSCDLVLTQSRELDIGFTIWDHNRFSNKKEPQPMVDGSKILATFGLRAPGTAASCDIENLRSFFRSVKGESLPQIRMFKVRTDTAQVPTVSNSNYLSVRLQSYTNILVGNQVWKLLRKGNSVHVFRAIWYDAKR